MKHKLTKTILRHAKLPHKMYEKNEKNERKNYFETRKNETQTNKNYFETRKASPQNARKERKNPKKN